MEASPISKCGGRKRREKSQKCYVLVGDVGWLRSSSKKIGRRPIILPPGAPGRRKILSKKSVRFNHIVRIRNSQYHTRAYCSCSARKRRTTHAATNNKKMALWIAIPIRIARAANYLLVARLRYVRTANPDSHDENILVFVTLL